GDAGADRERAAAAGALTPRPRAVRGRGLSSLPGLLGAREAGLQRVLLDLRGRGGLLAGPGVVRRRRALVLRGRVLWGLLRPAAVLLLGRCSGVGGLGGARLGLAQHGLRFLLRHRVLDRGLHPLLEVLVVGFAV